MNLMITADNILDIANNLQTRVNMIESQLEKLTGPFACDVASSGLEISATTGSLGAKLEEAFNNLIRTENQLSNMLCHLRDNVLETSNAIGSGPTSKRREPEPVEAADLPRFLKKVNPSSEDFVGAVARDLGVECI